MEFLQKKQINGVKVNITISLDVKMVKAATKKYKIVNNTNWLLLALLVARLAKYLNREDALFATVYNGRSDSRLLRDVGMFVHGPYMGGPYYPPPYY